MNKFSFLDLHRDTPDVGSKYPTNYRTFLINDLCINVDDDRLIKLKDLLNYVIDKKYMLFDREEFKGSFYEGEDDTLDLILPTIRRVYSGIFISPPTLLLSLHKDIVADPPEKRLELLYLIFDIDIFIDYLVDMLLKSKNVLNIFYNLDRTVEILNLIVGNYIAGLVKEVRDCEDHTQAIRDIKIKKIINDRLVY